MFFRDWKIIIDLSYPLINETKYSDFIFCVLILCFSQSRQRLKASASKFQAVRLPDQARFHGHFDSDAMSFVVLLCKILADKTSIIHLTEFILVRK